MDAPDVTPEQERAEGEGRERRRALIWSLAVSAILALCLWYLGLGTPATSMTISSGDPGGVYSNLSDELADILNEAFPGFPRGRRIVFANLASRGAVENVMRIRQGQAQLALAEEGIELQKQNVAAGAGGPGAPEPIEIRTLIQLFSSPLKIVARRDIGFKGAKDSATLESLSDLKTLTEIRSLAKQTPVKAFIGAEGNGTRKVASLVLDHYGFITDLDGRPDGPVDLAVVGHAWSFDRAKEALEANEIQIAIFLTAYGTEAVKDLAGKGRFALLEVDRAEGIHRSHPFLDVTSIPTASYPAPAKFPPKETKTLAVDEVLIGSSTLSDREAYRIVEAVFLHSHELGSSFQFLVPLSKANQLAQRYYYPPHPGATAFYQDRPEPAGLLDFIAHYHDLMLALFSICGTSLAVYHFLAGRWRSRPLVRQLERARTKDAVLAVEGEASRLFASKKIDKETYESLKEFARVRLSRLDEKD